MQFLLIFPTFNTADTEGIKYMSRINEITQQKKNLLYNSVDTMCEFWIISIYNFFELLYTFVSYIIPCMFSVVLMPSVRKCNINTHENKKGH